MSNVPMTRPDEVLAVHNTRYFHSSTFVELEEDGRILHVANRTFTTSDDGGLTWSGESQRRDVDGNEVGGGGTSLVKLSGNGIGLAAMAKGKDPRANSGVVFWRSEDAGETWEPPVRVTPAGVGTHVYQDVLLRTSSGRLILPVYILLGQGQGPGDVKPPSNGKLVNTTPAQIRSIPSAGHLLMVWNQENEEEIKRGYNRTRLSSAVSRNGGRRAGSRA